MTALELERELVSLAGALDWPDHTDLAAEVRAALVGGTQPRDGAATRVPLRLRLRPAVAFAVVALIAVAVLIASPAARTAVAQWLGVRGIAIERGVGAEDAAALQLGDAVTLAQAQAAVGFAVRPLPGIEPAAVLLDRTVPGGAVTFVYADSPALPAGVTPHVGALLTLLAGGDDPSFVKGLLEGADRVDPVEVAGHPGLWVAAEHRLTRRGPSGELLARTSGSVLLWEARGVTHRLEVALPLDQAVALGASLEPGEPGT